MKIEDITKFTNKELHDKLSTLRLDIAKSKLELVTKVSNKSHKIKLLKKDIARVLTVINSK